MLSDNLFSDIANFNARMIEYSSSEFGVEFGIDEISEASTQALNMIDSSSFVHDSMYTISIDSAGCAIDNALLKTSHIEYAVTLTRTSDGEAVTVMKRYKEVMCDFRNVESSIFSD